MSRRWIVTTLLLSSCFAANAVAQHAGKSIIDRLPFMQGDQTVGPQPARYGPPAQRQARPATGQIVQTAATSPRAPRDHSGRGRSANNGGGAGRSLLSRFSLSNLLPGRDEPSQHEQPTDYPLPYDPATTRSPRAQPTAGAAVRQRSGISPQPSLRPNASSASQPLIVSDQQRGAPPRTATTPVGGRQDVGPTRGAQSRAAQTIVNPAMPQRGVAAQRTSPRSAPSQPTASAPPARRTAARDVTPTQSDQHASVRKSPTLDLRRGELQDALAELRSSKTPESKQPAIELPSAAEEAALPRYLESKITPTPQEAPTAAAAVANPVARRMQKVESLDLSDSLLGDSGQSESTSDANSLRPQSNRSAASPKSDNASANVTPTESGATDQRSEVDSIDAPDRREPRVASAADFGNSLNQWDAGDSRTRSGSSTASEENRLRRSRTDDFGRGSQAASGAGAAGAGLSIDPQLGASFAERADAESGSSQTPVLFRYRQPLIASRVEGPRQVVVGQTAVYQVMLSNSGETPARELEAQVAVPSWAELVDATAATGRVEMVQAESDEKVQIVRWRLFDLSPQQQQSLELKLIPRDGRSLKLGVRWSHAPVGGETTVEVQEPKLQLELSGPAEVLFGKPQRYQLTLSNPGDGVAQGVHLALTPPGAKPSEALRHTVGVLEPGRSKSIELELTPRDAGDLEIVASAAADGGLEASAVKKILCRQALLEVDWRGPEKKYAGALATYYLRVRNPGTAPTETVDVSVSLPEGVELISASQGHSIDRRRGEVVWRTPSLQPSQERFMQLQCRLTDPGATEFKLLAATPDSELSDERSIHTEVVALADLKMEVSDPKGPVAVGQDAVYEVVIRNRGTTAATGVDVIALFSAGIEPTSVDGRQHQVHDGRVTFRPIDYLPAGEEVTLRIHAAASEPGSHIFRAEVSCPELEVKLSAEEATRFFADEQQWDTAAKAYDEQPESPHRY